MDTTVNREQFARALAMARRVVPPKVFVADHERVLITVSVWGGRLIAAGPTATIAIDFATASFVGAEEETAWLPVIQLADLVAALPGTEVRLSTQKPGGHAINVRSGKSRAVINGFNPEDASRENPGSLKEWVHHPKAGDFARGIRRVFHAAATDDTRPMLSGVLFEASADDIRMTTANGFCLSTTHETFGEVVNQALLPLATARMLAGMLPEEGDLIISNDANHMQVQGPGVRLTGTLIDAKFPDYGRLLVRQGLTVARCDLEELRRAAIVAMAFRPESNIVFLFIGDNGLTVASQHSEYGMQAFELPCSLEGEAITISVNGAYLKEGLAAFHGSADVELRLSGSQQGMIMSAVGEAATAGIEMVMPMSVTQVPDLSSVQDAGSASVADIADEGESSGEGLESASDGELEHEQTYAEAVEEITA